jgi:hypothetical protein
VVSPSSPLKTSSHYTPVSTLSSLSTPFSSEEKKKD